LLALVSEEDVDAGKPGHDELDTARTSSSTKRTTNAQSTAASSDDRRSQREIETVSAADAIAAYHKGAEATW